MGDLKSISEVIRDKDVVNVGDHVIIQRNNHMKLQKVTSNNKVSFGKDQIPLSGIIGKPFWTTFKIESVKKGEFILTEYTGVEDISAILIKDSGEDNRNICDDGSSQMLSKEAIVDLRDSGLSSSEILGQLVDNSKTFMNKTEFSQKKYLKKKEKKYYDFITIRKPTIRLVVNILHTQDPMKILGLRMDTLSQLSTAINMHSDGTYILYESGCQGIVAASMLNCISESGNLIYVHPDYTPKRNAISAMNFDAEQMERLYGVNIQSLLRKLWQDDEVRKPVNSENETSKIVSVEAELDEVSKPAVTNSDKEKCNSENENGQIVSVKAELEVTSRPKSPEHEEVMNEKKRKFSDDDESKVLDKKIKLEETLPKRPQWEIRTEKAANILKTKRAEGLVIIAREHPTNIVDILLPYLGLSKPFIVYSPYREVLQELYVHLKSKHSVADLWLTETWIRDHQVLPERTHPDVLMSSSGGYLLTGILVEG